MRLIVTVIGMVPLSGSFVLSEPVAGTVAVSGACVGVITAPGAMVALGVLALDAGPLGNGSTVAWGGAGVQLSNSGCAHKTPTPVNKPMKKPNRVQAQTGNAKRLALGAAGFTGELTGVCVSVSATALGVGGTEDNGGALATASAVVGLAVGDSVLPQFRQNRAPGVMSCPQLGQRSPALIGPVAVGAGDRVAGATAGIVVRSAPQWTQKRAPARLVRPHFPHRVAGLAIFPFFPSSLFPSSLTNPSSTIDCLTAAAIK